MTRTNKAIKGRSLIGRKKWGVLWNKLIDCVHWFTVQKCCPFILQSLPLFLVSFTWFFSINRNKSSLLSNLWICWRLETSNKSPLWSNSFSTQKIFPLQKLREKLMVKYSIVMWLHLIILWSSLPWGQKSNWRLREGQGMKVWCIRVLSIWILFHLLLLLLTWSLFKAKLDPVWEWACQWKLRNFKWLKMSMWSLMMLQVCTKSREKLKRLLIFWKCQRNILH